MDLVVAPVLQIFGSLKSFAYAYYISDPENCPASFGEMILARFTVLDAQVMCLDTHSHSLSHGQSSMNVSGSTTGQARAVNDSIPLAEKEEFVSAKKLSFDACMAEEIIYFVDQLVNAEHDLCNIEQHPQSELLRFFLSHAYQYHCGLSVTVQADGIPANTSKESMMK